MPFIALAALEPVIIAILALICLVAAAVLVKAVAAALPNWHIPGFSSLRSWVANNVGGFLRTINNYMDALAGVLGDVVAAPVLIIKTLFNDIQSVFASIYDALHHTIFSVIPAAIHALRVALVTTIHTVRVYAYNLVHDLHARIVTAINAIYKGIHVVKVYAYDLMRAVRLDVGKIVRRLDTAIHAAQLAAVAVAEKYVRAYLTTALAKVNLAVANVKADITAASKAANAYTDRSIKALAGTVATTATAVAGGLITDIDTTVGNAFTVVWPKVLDDVGVIEGIIGAGLPNVVAGLKAIPRAVPTDLAGEAIATGALAGLLTRYLRDCGIPNCRNISKFGRDIQGLITAVEGGSLFAVLAGLAVDPKDTAETFATVLGPIGDAGMSAGRNLLGVA